MSDLKGKLYVEFRNDKHVINTDRARVIIADADTGCAEILASFAESDFAVQAFEAPWIDWHYDADMCAFAGDEPVAIPQRASGTPLTTDELDAKGRACVRDPTQACWESVASPRLNETSRRA